jgi:competence ComEA-like helix-hairpin-helix protein
MKGENAMKSKRSHWGRSMAVWVLLSLVPPTLGEESPKIDLNTATLSQLDSLPGIGPVIAERILELREKSGPYKRIEDLMNIRGIGEKKFLKLKDLITIKPEQQSDERIQTSEIQKPGS